MATFFGEVLPVFSRAFDEDEEYDEHFAENDMYIQSEQFSL